MHNLFDLTGKRALITGGARGIGYLLASGLGRYGASVIVTATTTANAERAAEQLRAEGLDALGVSFDITDGAEVSRAIEQLEQRQGPIDILINNAGIQRRHPLLSFPEADWDEIIAKKLNYGYTDFMSYSIDFRRRILSIKKHEELSIRETAKRFHIGTTTIVRWTKQIDARPANSRQRKIDKSALERDVEQYPDAYQRERAEQFGVCQMAICKALKKLQLTYKKNSASSKSRRRR